MAGLVLTVLAWPSIVAADVADANWSREFAPPGIGDYARAIAEFDGDLYIGGSFTEVGGSTVANIARWRGEAWEPLGSGVDGTVRALLVFQGSLIAAGEFTSAGGLLVNHVARWDGAAWYPLGEGLPGRVVALAEHAGSLYAAGDFSGSTGKTDRIAWFDGAHWQVVPTGPNGPINALLSYAGSLVVGGDFTQVTDFLASNVARWDGSAWHLMDAGGGHIGVGGRVYCLTTLGSDLIAAGDVGVGSGCVARWNGSAWSALGGGLAKGFSNVFALAERGGLLYAGGILYSTSGPYSSNWVMSAWNGSYWQSAGFPSTEFDAVIWAMGTYDGDLVVSGTFEKLALREVRHLVRYDGVAWRPFGNGVDNMVRALDVYNGQLAVGGAFTHAGGLPVDHAALWSGTEWSRMGTLSSGTGIVGMGYYTASLMACFEGVGLRSWTGSDWGGAGPLGTNAFIEYGGTLVVAGSFTQIGSTLLANHIAKRDGSFWAVLGSGTTQSGLDGTVYALTLFQGDLIAGGDFTQAGFGTANHIARWDGSEWHPLGDGVNGSVRTLAVMDGELVAGGFFTTAGGQPANRIARWDGAAWSSMGGGMNGPVFALHVAPPLIAGGSFTQADGAPARGAAWWTGHAWRGFGSGLNGQVMAIAHQGSQTYFGGVFTTAGGYPSQNLALWSGGFVPVRLLSFTAARVPEGALLRWRIADTECLVGFHVHRAMPGEGRRRISTTLVGVSAGAFSFLDEDSPEGRAQYWLEELDRDGSTTWHGPVELEAGEPTPLLLRVSPNPSRGNTEIEFRLMRAEVVSLTIHDLQGRCVRTLRAPAKLDPGVQRITWDGRSDHGVMLPAGVYFVRLVEGDLTRGIRIVRVP